jgi:hypothetical protein
MDPSNKNLLPSREIMHFETINEEKGPNTMNCTSARHYGPPGMF